MPPTQPEREEQPEHEEQPERGDQPERKEWTLMFYFATDNPLAPSTVSQLKALKNAGFHSEANVIARFDPHIEGTPTHIFDVNSVFKVEAAAVRQAMEMMGLAPAGDGDRRANGDDGDEDDGAAFAVHKVGFSARDPYVRNLVFDKLWGAEETLEGKKIEDLIRKKVVETVRKRALSGARRRANGGDDGGGGFVALKDEEFEALVGGYAPPDPKAPAKAADKGKQVGALEEFLNFCATHYPARHYMLFILGHGLVVGNDMFLLDEHAEDSSLSLKGLGDALWGFSKREGKLELVGFHSCSMSSVEVACEIQDAAKYMIASQGPEFVGSWPYTQILVRVFNDLVRGSADIEKTIGKIFSYCFYNSYDFQLAGYSFDLALCDLSKAGDTLPLVNALASQLTRALDDEVAKGLILLAHWEAQSFWRDTYTDLFDFCLCLKKKCEAASVIVSGDTAALLTSITLACDDLMEKLLGEGGFVMRTGFAGPSYQYSHGLSVFFPWSEPTNKVFWPAEYKGYKFCASEWDKFLVQYFDKTMRNPRRAEPGHRDERPLDGVNGSAQLDEELLEGITAKLFGSEPSQLGKGGGGDATGKGGGGDASGDDCDCPPIKNYPSYTRARRAIEAGEVKKGEACLPTGVGAPRKAS